MHDTEHISELLLRWEQLRQSGAAPSADELCADCPQLADEVGRRIRAVQQMENLLGVSSSPSDQQAAILRQPADDETADAQQQRLPLPNLPGYELLRVLGRGGMGIVYQARQNDLGRTVAIKMIDRSLPGRTQLKRFRDEARAIARLHHPHIVQIYDFGEADGIPYFSMEYVDGGSLQRPAASEPLVPREAARLVEKVARAVHQVHVHGFVHRDLKSANVLLTADGEPKITDFGLAKELDVSDGHTRTGEVLGTLSYMAPEQVDHTLGEIDPRTDVYALGVILYETLTGSPPFTGSPASVLQQVLKAPPKEPVSANREIAADLKAISTKCLEKYPADRYATAEDLADDLQRFLDNKPIRARRIGSIRRGVKWVRRTTQVVGLALGLIFVALVAIPVVNAVSAYQAERRIRARAVEVAPQAREILQRNCYQCHGADPQDVKKKLDILDHAVLLDSKRTIVVPGRPEDSRLVQRIADGSMPPEKLERELPRLSEEELSVLDNWILGGAPPFAAAESQQTVAPAVAYSAIAERAKQIFISRCYECHKFDVAEGGIKILHHRLLIHVRKVVVPGNPDDSELFQLITSDDDERRMPPAPMFDDEPPSRLGPDEIEVIRRWIADGARPFPKSR